MKWKIPETGNGSFDKSFSGILKRGLFFLIIMFFDAMIYAWSHMNKYLSQEALIQNQELLHAIC